MLDGAVVRSTKDLIAWLVTAGSSCEPKDDKNDRCCNPNTDRYLRACREVVALNAFYLRVGHRGSHSCLPVCDSKSFFTRLTNVALELCLIPEPNLHSSRLT